MVDRNERLKVLMHQELAVALRQVKDPGVAGFLTVTGLDLSADRKVARVYYSILGDPAQRRSTALALERAADFIRQLMRKRLALKVIPRFDFIYDDTPRQASKIEGLLEKLRREKLDR